MAEKYGKSRDKIVIRKYRHEFEHEEILYEIVKLLIELRDERLEFYLD